jgi:hypothetical protein
MRSALITPQIVARGAPHATTTYKLHGTSNGSVEVPMQAELTITRIEARAGVRAVPMAGGFSLRADGDEVAVASVTAASGGFDTYTVSRGAITALRATTFPSDWAMADRSAPSLATVLAMISVDPDGDAV